MSRHRNVRSMNYDEEYEGYDDVYGHSVEDDYCVSPSASHYLYDRSKTTNPVSSFLPQNDNIAEEQEGEEADQAAAAAAAALDSTRSQLESLTLEQALKDLVPEEEILLKQGLDEIRSIIGIGDGNVSENLIIGQLIKWKFNVEKALDGVLNVNQNICENEKPPPKSKPLDDKTGATKIPGILPGFNVKPSPFLPPSDSKPPPPKIPALAIDTSKPKPTVISSPKLPVRVVPAKSSATATLGFDLGGGKGTGSGSDSRGNSLTPSPIPGIIQDEPMSANTSSVPVTKDKVKSQSQQKQQLPPSFDHVLSSYSKERSTSKQLINMLVIGHVDAGKSTLMGHLLFQLGQVSKKTMHKFEQESKKVGKQSFVYAWVLDETGEERTRGITMDIATSTFETPTKTIVLLDAPGHKDFIPNMITGASQADVAILVVDATTGEFETGFESGGQTREHALLVRSLGATQLLIAINKLDTVSWSQSRFDEIKARLTTFLVKQAGFRESDLRYVPVSGLIGENLTKKATDPALVSWYSGQTLLEAIDTFRPPVRPVAKPLRLTVSDVFKGQGGGSLSVAGKVQTGMIQPGDKVLVQPSGESVIVKAVTLDNASSSNTAYAGDPILLTLTALSDHIVICMGDVLSDPNHPCKVSSRFQARLVCFDAMTIPLTRGFTGVMHLGTVSEQIVVKKLISQLDRGSGEVIKEKPRVLGKNCSGVVEFQINKSVVMEEFSSVKELGRFTLRSVGVTVAAGVITKIM